MQKKTVRQVADICMTVLLPMLMAYSLIGERFHEIIGTAMLVLFILHHILNRNWYKSLPKGKYTPRRVFQTLLNFLLLACMILQPVSGILMSKHLYTFIQVEGASAAAREIHMCMAYWGLVLMCLHAGTHLQARLSRRRSRKKGAWTVIVTVFAVISLYGCRAFVRRQFPEYMFRRTAFAFFDYSEPRIFFFLDYIAIMALFAFAGCLITVCLNRMTKKAG